MTRATITIKRKNGIYDQLWYVNCDGYPSGLGKEIYANLKTVDDVERAVVLFKECTSWLETSFTLGEVHSIKPILEQPNDYAYVLDEETGKWGYYAYHENKLYSLEEELLREEEDDDEDIDE